MGEWKHLRFTLSPFRRFTVYREQKMCAIFGWIKWHSPLSDWEINAAGKALETMRHRGPDFQDEWFEGSVYMGHCRLSIIDLSHEANQPFKDEDGRFVIIFNGEIYNYIELRAELKKYGVKFRTSSDTEVLLAAFKLWGEDAFLRLNGMFAFGVYDRVLKKHYLVRDHLGQKPLYYYFYEDGLVYASELRAILSLKGFDWHLDKNNFLKFLVNSCYMWDTTPLQGVKKLLPGYFLEIDDKKINLKQFWDSLPGENIVNVDFEEAVVEFQRHLDYSCEISLRSDVSKGVFLSGGIDSSLVLDACHRVDPKISSYSVSMGESDFDELPKVKHVVDHLKIDSYKSYLMDRNSVEESVEAFFDFSDEPHGDPGFVNSWFLSKSCRSDITMAVSGDGADELFAGYIPFQAIGKEFFFRNIPECFLSLTKKMVRNFFSGSDGYVSLQFKALAFMQGFPAHRHTRFPLWLGAVSPEDLYNLCPWQDISFFSRMGEEGTIFEDFRKVLARMEGNTYTQAFLYFYQKFFLPEFVCMHTDRASMQNSLEARSPFLSVPLIEYANSLPDSFKTDRGKLKRILKYAAKKRGFTNRIYEQKKQGFTFPLARWLKTSLNVKMEKMISSKIWDNGLIDIAYLNILKEQHLNNKRNNYRILFNLMAFQRWMEKYPYVSVDF